MNDSSILNIALRSPGKNDVILNRKFEQYLDKIEPLATSAEVELRKSVLNEIQKIINKWIQEASTKQGFTGEALRMACGKVFTFGSFRLGLVTPASDIDALCVAPKHISRDDFFESLLPILEGNQHVSELSGVPDAVVPIIKMKYREVEVDLTFARLNLAVVDSKLENLDSDNLLKHLDEKTVRSINGCRVADALLSLVPNKGTYITVLRFVRHWAKKRGLYSNAMGFFGGITWAILSARVCQMYPNMSPLQVSLKFFLVFSRWNWTNPVTLCPITQSAEVGLMGFKVWNPKINSGDRFHLMPIITPAFPCMNSTYNVTETTRRIITSELARAHQFLSQVMTAADFEPTLEKLVQPPAFLSLFNFYLAIDVNCGSVNAYTKLKGFVESRIRMLLKFLESPVSGVQQSRPWPKEFDLEPTRCTWLVGLSFPPAKAGGAVADLRPSISQFLEKLADWAEKDNFQEGTDYSVRLFHFSKRHPFMTELRKTDSSTSLTNGQVDEYLENLNHELRGGSGPGWSTASLDDLVGTKKRRLDLEVDIS
jgi:poly(A) polymerase